MTNPRCRRRSHREARSRGLLRSALLTVLLVAGAATAPELHAQEEEQAEPLRKNEVVNLLTSGLYTRAEAARRIRNRCLAFRPTERDFADFRALGAGERVMGAIRECLARARGGGAGQPGGPLPDTPPLWLAEVDSVITVPAGDTATVFARVMRGERPVPGEDVVLRDPADLILQQPGAVLQASSDSIGGVRFRVPAPTRVGELPLVLDVDEDSARVRFRVRPASPGRVDVEPRTLRWEGADDSLSVSFRVADRFGNLLPSVPVALVTPRREMVAGGETGAEGRATVRVAGGDLEGVDSLGVIAGGRRLAALSVVREEADLAGEAPETGAEPAAEPAAPRSELQMLAAEAERLLAAGQAAEAASLLDRATGMSPDSAGLWIRLAEARRASGDADGAAASLREAMERAPDRREELRDRLRSVITETEARRGRLTAWGGGSLGGGDEVRGPEFTTESGFHRGLVEIWPVPGAFGLFAEYDRGIEPERPELVRGSAGFESLFGGFLVEWGEGRRFSTRVAGGNRERPPGGMNQRMLRLEQTIRFGDGTRTDFRRAALRLAATVGEWAATEEREYFGRLGVDIPVDESFRVATDLMVSEAIGTWSTRIDRPRYTELRLQVAPAYRSAGGLEAEVGLGVGRTDHPRGLSSSVTLLDTFVRGSVPVTRNVRFDLFYRHQAPALNTELDFHVFSAGLTAELPY